ncbi:MAG: MoaD/ThiS family protein [Firmicutes bacterium]|nr:MoaD/ThiS family protein [Bacillota bacterium]
MKITVNVFGYTKGPLNTEVDFQEGATVADVVAWLRSVDRLPQTFEECHSVPENSGPPEVLRGLLVVVNHVNVNVLDGPNTVLKDGDRVTVLAAMAGG